MKILDLLIIYFACGAPFGMYEVTTISGGLTMRGSAGIVLRVCLWPLFASLILAKWLTGRQTAFDSSLDPQIGSIRTQMEELVFAGESMSSIFDFREILSLYGGLSEAANLPQPISGTIELFDLSSNENKELATICLARKNQRRLSVHHAEARSRFIEMVSALALTDRDGAFLKLAVELAACLKDQQAVDSLTALSSTETSARPEQTTIKSRSASSIV